MITQPCKQCGRVLALNAGFYRHRKYATGRMTVCKKCHKANVAENRELKADYYREKKRQWSARPENVAKRKAYAQTERGRAAHRAACRTYYRFKRMELAA